MLGLWTHFSRGRASPAINDEWILPTRVKAAGCKQCLPNVAASCPQNQNGGLHKKMGHTTKDASQTLCRSFCQVLNRLFEAFRLHNSARGLSRFGRRPSKNGGARTTTRGAGEHQPIFRILA